MIGYLNGKIISKGQTYMVVDTHGVGYKVYPPASLLLSVKIGQEAALFIHTYVREDQLSLYGFATPTELELFELLLTVSGIGPKVALSILSSTTPTHIRSAIASGEAVVFTKVSGVGKKTAERLIIELREKIGETGSGELNIKATQDFSESLDALVSLGYSRQEAREALNRVSKDLADSSSIVKAALRVLGGRQ